MVGVKRSLLKRLLSSLVILCPVAICENGCKIAVERGTWLLQAEIVRDGGYSGDTMHYETRILVVWLGDPITGTLLLWTAPYDRQKDGEYYGRTHAHRRESGQKEEARCSSLGGQECCESSNGCGTEQDGDVKPPMCRTQVRLIPEGHSQEFQERDRQDDQGPCAQGPCNAKAGVGIGEGRRWEQSWSLGIASIPPDHSDTEEDVCDLVTEGQNSQQV